MKKTLIILAGLAVPAFAQPGDTWMFPGETLANGSSMRSRNGQYQLNVQNDGNLVLYRQGRPIWSTNTMGRGNARLVFQTDGNLVLLNSQNSPIWASNTAGQNPHALTLQDDGNLCLYRFKGAIWSTNTGR